MKLGMRLWLACGVAFFGLCEGMAQVAPPVAILKVDGMQKSYRPGDVVVLRTMTTNISRNDICFETSPQASFEVELFDLKDKPGVDRILPAMQERLKTTDAKALNDICPTINPGRSEIRNIALNMLPNLVAHAGLYKVMVGRKEVGNDMVIWANPVAIRIRAK